MPASREWLFPGGDELFRGVYTRSSIGASAREIVAVCSAITGEGKTTMSLGLGVTLAQDFPERRVVVVETDLQRPVLATDFALEPHPGLATYLEGTVPMQAVYRPTFLENLHLVPGGGPVANPARLLRSSAMAAAIEAMRQTHDVVILDVPAILASSNALLVANLADAAIFVVRAGVTPQTLVSKAVDQLDASKLRGVVINEVTSPVPGWLRRLLGL
jgi:capsular exopolysaccharide synthesis family protein